jgi:hypothetical protein
MKQVILTFINKDLRAVTVSIDPDGTISEEMPVIFDGDHYAEFDDPYLVEIAVSTEYEGVSEIVAEGSDPDGALAWEYVRDELLRDPIGFYEAVAC